MSTQTRSMLKKTIVLRRQLEDMLEHIASWNAIPKICNAGRTDVGRVVMDGVVQALTRAIACCLRLAGHERKF